MDESSNVLAKVQMKLTVFKPSPGKLLTGIVVDTSSTHIGTRTGLTPDLLVYGLFNAVLKKEDIKRLTFINQVDEPVTAEVVHREVPTCCGNRHSSPVQSQAVVYHVT